METILVDAVDTFVIQKGDGFEVFENMRKLLETFPNRKIILTGATSEGMKKYGLDHMPYDVFTLNHDPEKTDSKYFELMLQHFRLNKDDVVYFEHNPEAVKSAQTIGITSYHYNEKESDLDALEKILKDNLCE